VEQADGRRAPAVPRYSTPAIAANVEKNSNPANYRIRLMGALALSVD
jgi:hypothetical protein